MTVSTSRVPRRSGQKHWSCDALIEEGLDIGRMGLKPSKTQRGFRNEGRYGSVVDRNTSETCRHKIKEIGVFVPVRDT
jgi:hypothetical protein